MDDQPYEDDPSDFVDMPNLIFINDSERCGRYLKALSKLRGNDHHSHASRGLSAIRRLQLASSNELPIGIIASCQCIQLVGNHLKDLSCLLDAHISLPYLLSLNVSFNSLRDIPFLSCPQLTALDVSHNRLISLDFISDLTQLCTLRTQHNSIDSLQPLQWLASLQEVWVSHNKLEWSQFLHCSNSRLTVLVKTAYGEKPEKPKLNDFLYAIIPTLQVIDGQLVADLLATGQLSGEDSVDVRVMLTQARAQTKRDVTTLPMEPPETMRSTTSHRHKPTPRKQMESEDDLVLSGPDSMSSRHGHRKPRARYSDSEVNTPDEHDELSSKKKPVQSASGKRKGTESNKQLKTLAELNVDLDSVLEGVQGLKQQQEEQEFSRQQAGRKSK